MGIYDRDYTRADYRGGALRGRGGTGDAIVGLIVANVIAFAIQLAWTQSGPEVRDDNGDVLFRSERVSVLAEWCSLDAAKVARGQLWRLTTYDFLHDENGIWHLFWNMYVLYAAGRKLQDLLGPREMLLFYLTSGVVSGAAFVVWQLARGGEGAAIGASGAVAAVMLLYALHWPREIWMIMGVIPVPVVVLVLITLALDLFPLLRDLGQRPIHDGVAHVAHLGGMAFAYLYFLRHWRIDSLLGGLQGFSLARWRRARTRLRVHQPAVESPAIDAAALQQRVDELLQKIYEHGEISLTTEERDVLNHASRVLRDRRKT